MRKRQYIFQKPLPLFIRVLQIVAFGSWFGYNLNKNSYVVWYIKENKIRLAHWAGIIRRMVIIVKLHSTGLGTGWVII